MLKKKTEHRQAYNFHFSPYQTPAFILILLLVRTSSRCLSQLFNNCFLFDWAQLCNTFKIEAIDRIVEITSPLRPACAC